MPLAAACRHPLLCDRPLNPGIPGFLPQNPESEAARKKAEADRLRAAEKFMRVGDGSWSAQGACFMLLRKPARSWLPRCGRETTVGLLEGQLLGSEMARQVRFCRG